MGVMWYLQALADYNYIKLVLVISISVVHLLLSYVTLTLLLVHMIFLLEHSDMTCI